MKEKRVIGWMLAVFMLTTVCIQGADKAYHTPGQINGILNNLAKSNPGITSLHRLAVTPGGKQVLILEIGPEVKRKQKKLPAIFVAANFEGKTPIAGEAAIYLAKQLLKQKEARQDKTWYILAMPNPDAAARFFEKPLRMDSRNARPYNDDMDDRIDEDGVDDLDKNGIITMMRVKDPQGRWLPVDGEPRLMKRADWTKGEKGIYKVYSEGIDNDKDGKYNEDGPGGVNIGANFPHLFKFYTKTGGLWAGSEKETYNLFKFIYSHPEIAMTIGFGDSNFCLNPPKGGRKGTADFSKIKVPKRLGQRFGFDPDTRYTMKEIIDQVQPFMPEGVELDAGMVASFMGLGAAVNPQKKDLKFYNVISKEFKEFLKKAKLDAKRLDPAKAKDGSFELWAYYHLGVPSFTLDFWAIPKLEKKKKGPKITPDKLAAMSNEEFLALGEEKIDAFLKSSGAPGNIKAKMLMGMVKSGSMNTKRMAEMMKKMAKPKDKGGADADEKSLLAFSDKQLNGKGFLPWKTFQHPTLGEVEIGGIVPYTYTTPPAKMVEPLLKKQIPWVLELSAKLPRIKIAEVKVKPMGSGLYRVKAWVQNTGFLPYPTSMGTRNKRIKPVVVTISGGNYKIIEGKKRSLIKSIDGFSTKKVEWILRVDKPVKLKMTAAATSAWSDSAELNLRPGGGK